MSLEFYIEKSRPVGVHEKSVFVALHDTELNTWRRVEIKMPIAVENEANYVVTNFVLNELWQLGQAISEPDFLRLVRLRETEGSNPIAGKSAEQVEQWIDANVTNLATAKQALKVVGRILALHEQELAVLRSLAQAAYKQMRGS